MSEQFYRYVWGNKKTSVGRHRLRFKGRKCKVIAWGVLNSVEIEFIDNSERLCCSRNALRKVI